MTALRLDPRHGLVRGLRAGLLSGPAVTAAVVAHAVGGGCVNTMSVVVAGGLAWPAAVALLGRHRSLAALTGWLVVVQALTHALLELACPTGSAVGHLHGGTGLLAGHAAAVLVLALLFATGDRAVWTAHALRRSAARALSRLAALVVPVLLPHLPLVRTEPQVSARHLFEKATPLSRRGPPALLHV